jgi:AraC-like DNA-binding protein/mannose-6-phosphate isomerase-like protein (cupin superfamily)
VLAFQSAFGRRRADARYLAGMTDHDDLASHHRLWRQPQVLGGLWYFTSTSTRFPIHTQDELEFNLVVRGTARLKVEDGEQELAPGMIVWLPAGPSHGLVSVSDDLVLWVASFRPEFVEDLRRVDSSLSVTGHVRTTWPEPADFEALCRQSFELLMHPRESASFNERLANLLLLAWRTTDRTPFERRLHPGVARAARLLSSPDGPSTTPRLARRVGLDRNQLVPLFREQMGVSLVHYRNHARVQRFVRLLAQRQGENALRAALEAGFRSYAQFFRAFRTVTGWTPSQHARLLVTGELPPDHWIDPLAQHHE